MFVLYYDAATKTVKGLNGSGRSPRALDVQHVKKQGITTPEIPLDNRKSPSPVLHLLNLHCDSLGVCACA